MYIYRCVCVSVCVFCHCLAGAEPRRDRIAGHRSQVFKYIRITVYIHEYVCVFIYIYIDAALRERSHGGTESQGTSRRYSIIEGYRYLYMCIYVCLYQQMCVCARVHVCVCITVCVREWVGGWVRGCVCVRERECVCVRESG